MVKSSEAEKNLAWEAQEQAKQNQAAAAALLTGATVVGVAPAGPCKLYVGNLNPQIDETELAGLFSPFGKLDFVQVVRDSTGKSQTYGYVQYTNGNDSTAAVAHWNGKMVAGASLKVSVTSTNQALLAAAVAAAPSAASAYEPVGELDDEEEKGGMKLTSNARAQLMSRLASSAGLQAPPSMFPTPGSLPPPPVVAAGPRIDPNLILEQGLLGPSSPIPTPYLLLKNMFNPQEEEGDNWDAEISDDVKEECSKYGPVLHIHIEKASKVGRPGRGRPGSRAHRVLFFRGGADPHSAAV